jgi:protein-disulfide isomerase
MKFVTGCALGALALALAGCGGGDEKGSNAQATANQNLQLKQIAAPNGGDWTQTVTQTPEGGFLMGNPQAAVKLVEYGSYTCGHCAEFAETATEPLQDKYVKSGQVSWEFRPFLLFPSDPGIALVARCLGPNAFFPITDQVYATQGEWIPRLQQLSPEQQQQLEAMAPAERAASLVRAAGLDQFFRQRGVPEARMNACLADQQALQDLAGITAKATEQGVTGTPAFLINGKLVQAGEWKALEPLIQAAL